MIGTEEANNKYPGLYDIAMAKERVLEVVVDV